MALCLYHFINCVQKFHKLRSVVIFSLRYASKSGPRNNYQNELVNMYSDYLLQEKSYKWSEFLYKVTLINRTTSGNTDLASKEFFTNKTQEELIHKISEYLRGSDINNSLVVIEVCKEKSYSLPPGLMLYLLKLFAKLGHKEGFKLMIEYYRDKYETEFNYKLGFKYYTAQLLWYAGCTEKSLNILEEFYKKNLFRHEVNVIVYDIIFNAVTNRGEASLILITNFAEKMLRSYDTYYPIVILWKNLMASEWYADQQLAKKLIETDCKLSDVIKPLIPMWCKQCIQSQKIDAVYRLCEVLLQYNCLDNYGFVLHDLFDYYYCRQNLKRCSAIVKSALDLQIPLKESYQKRFIVLLTTGKPDNSTRNNIEIPKSINYQINLKF